MGREKSILLVMLLLITSMLGNPVLSLPNQNDANSGTDAPDDASNAFALSYDTTYTGELGDSLINIDNEEDNHDYYYINVDTVGKLSVSYVVSSILHSSLSTVTIFDSYNTIGAETFWEDDPKMFLVVPIINTGNIMIGVNSYSDYVKYEMKITFTPGTYAQNDANSGGDADKLPLHAISLDTQYSGDIGYGSVTSTGDADTYDYYEIALTSSGYLNILSVLTTDESYKDLSIFVETDSYDTIYSQSLGFYDNSLYLTSPIPEAGTYIIVLDSYSWNSTYTIELSFTSATLPSQNDANTGSDASESLADAPIINLNSTVSGTIGEELIEISDNARDDYDLYKIEELKYGRLNISLRIISSYDSYPALWLKLYNSSDLFEFSIISFYASFSTFFESESVVLMPDNGYYIELYTSDKNITYDVSIEFVEMVQPTSESTTSSPNTSDPTSNTSDETAKNSGTDLQDTTDNVNTNSITFTMMFLTIFSVSYLIRKRRY